jgi:hypothetical protein
VQALRRGQRSGHQWPKQVVRRIICLKLNL